jgi:hypothetical protein
LQEVFGDFSKIFLTCFSTNVGETADWLRLANTVETSPTPSYERYCIIAKALSAIQWA